MVSNAAPDSASYPRWIWCQSVIQPSTAEYWHIGAITIRFASSTSPTRKGVNSRAPLIRKPPPLRDHSQREPFRCRAYQRRRRSPYQGDQPPPDAGGVGGTAVDVGLGVSGGFSDQAQITTATTIARISTIRTSPTLAPQPGLIASCCIASSLDQMKSPSRGWGFVGDQPGRGKADRQGGKRRTC